MLLNIGRVIGRSTDNFKMVDAAVQEKLEAGFAKMQADDSCKSLLKKFLTREVLDKTKDLKTSFGSTLLDVVQSGWFYFCLLFLQFYYSSVLSRLNNLSFQIF